MDWGFFFFEGGRGGRGKRERQVNYVLKQNSQFHTQCSQPWLYSISPIHHNPVIPACASFIYPSEGRGNREDWKKMQKKKSSCRYIRSGCLPSATNSVWKQKKKKEKKERKRENTNEQNRSNGQNSAKHDFPKPGSLQQNTMREERRQ